MKKLLNFTFIFFVFVSASAIFPIENVFSEILSHFCLQYLLISLLFLVVYCFLKKWKAVVVALLLFISFSSILIPFYVSPDAKKNEKFEDITLLQFNINYRHEDVNKVVDWINGFHSKTEGSATEIPDIVLIEEATPEIAKKLNALSAYYPYKISEAETGAYGMVLYSKIPINNYERKYFSRFSGQYTVAYMSTPNIKIPFVLVELHARSPGHIEKLNPRRFQLEEIANFISCLSCTGKILVGDLNTAPYSPYFKKLEKISGLRSFMRGHGVSGTWPNFLPFLCRIPLDHVLVSAHVETLERNVNSDLGSDHFPVTSRLRIHAK
jgi:endonuclease/exonuclease/phosphatase (EEP) superfamily protein YafD